MWQELLIYHKSLSLAFCDIDHTQESRQDRWSRPTVSENNHNIACRKHKKCSWTWIGCFFLCQISRLFSNWESFQQIELSIAHEKSQRRTINRIIDLDPSSGQKSFQGRCQFLLDWYMELVDGTYDDSDWGVFLCHAY